MVHGPSLASIHPHLFFFFLSPSFPLPPSLTQHSSAFPSFGVLRLIAGCPSFLKKSLTGSSWTLFSLLNLFFTFYLFLACPGCPLPIILLYCSTHIPHHHHLSRTENVTREAKNTHIKRKEKEHDSGNPSSSICCAKNKEFTSDCDRIHSPSLITDDAPFRSSISHSFHRPFACHLFSLLHLSAIVDFLSHRAFSKRLR